MPGGARSTLLPRFTANVSAAAVAIAAAAVSVTAAAAAAVSPLRVFVERVSPCPLSLSLLPYAPCPLGPPPPFPSPPFPSPPPPPTTPSTSLITLPSLTLSARTPLACPPPPFPLSRSSSTCRRRRLPLADLWAVGQYVREAAVVVPICSGGGSDSGGGCDTGCGSGSGSGSGMSGIPGWVEARAAKVEGAEVVPLARAEGGGGQMRGGDAMGGGAVHRRGTGWAPGVMAAQPPVMRGIVLLCSFCEHPLCLVAVVTLTDVVRASHVACLRAVPILVWLLLSLCRVHLLFLSSHASAVVLGGQGG